MNRKVLKEIGRRISKARTDANITQAELAAKMKVDRVTVTFWESGRYGIHISDLPELAQVLNTDVCFFVKIDPDQHI